MSHWIKFTGPLLALTLTAACSQTDCAQSRTCAAQTNADGDADAAQVSPNSANRGGGSSTGDTASEPSDGGETVATDNSADAGVDATDAGNEDPDQRVDSGSSGDSDGGAGGDSAGNGGGSEVDGGPSHGGSGGQTNGGSGGSEESGGSGGASPACVPLDACDLDATAAPDAPEIVAPFRGKYTGSLRAPASAETLRPTFEWTASDAVCGDVHYQIQLDDSCTPGGLQNCAFDSIEVDELVDAPSFQPESDLAVATVAPVGAKISWRVRACDESCLCSDWSDVAYLNVGRTRDDVNGDGYADIVVKAADDNESWLDVYFGSGQMNVVADARMPHLVNDARFAGDVNADGFADIVGVLPSQEPCGESLSGQHIRIVWGNSDPNQATVSDLCSTAGTPSVLFHVGFAGDLDGDGFDDLTAARGFGSDNNFRVFAGASEIAAVPLIDIVGQEQSYSFTQGTHSFGGGGDFDGDSYADMIVTEFDGGNPLLVHLVSGAASPTNAFSDTTTLADCASPGSVSNAGYLGDVPTWGIVCSSVFSSVSGGATLNVDTQLNTPGLQAASPPLDFDRDGSAEFFLASTESSPIIWEPGISTNVSFETLQAGTANRVHAADHTGDGRPDLAFSTSSFPGNWYGSSTSFNVSPLALSEPMDVTTSSGIVY